MIQRHDAFSATRDGFPVNRASIDGVSLGRLKSFAHMAVGGRTRLAHEMLVADVKRRCENFVELSSADDVYVVLRGFFEIVHPGHAVASIAGPGDFFGLCSLLYPEPARFSYRALGDAMVGKVAPDTFVELVFGVPLVNLTLIVDFALRQWWGGALMRQFSSAGVPLEWRIHTLLTKLAEKFGVRDSRGVIINIPLSHQVLADLVGASRTKTTEAIGKLTRAGKLVHEHRRLLLIESPPAPPQTT